jgi:hypothetical protein
MVDIRYRPLDEWPGEETPSWKRKRSTFSAGWGSTLILLEHELVQLKATNVLFLVDVPPEDFRVTDGHPKSKARWGHPGVVVAFDSIHGPLKYACDAFDSFPDNVRAVALGLEALRKVERYGIVKRGEQYKGWSQLPPGTAMGAEMTKEEAWRVLIDLGGGPADLAFYGDPAEVEHYYRLAAKAHHPDRGGNGDLMSRATAARERLLR